MKISPLSQTGATVGAISAGDPTQQTTAQRVRALRMNTNATPGRTPETEKLTVPPNIDATEPADETKPLSPQLAALAKQRRALQVKERELADKEKAIAERSATPADAIDRARLKSDPLGVLLEAGVTYDQLTEAVLANESGVTPEIRALKAQVKALEDGLDKKLTDRDQLAEQQALAEMRREALGLLQGEDYALVREQKQLPSVLELIKRTYHKTGEVLDVREALGLVESELMQDALRLAKVSKVQSQLAPAPALETPRPMRTLTNRDTASVSLSAKARAIAAFNGTLKK